MVRRRTGGPLTSKKAPNVGRGDRCNVGDVEVLLSLDAPWLVPTLVHTGTPTGPVDAKF